MKLSIVILFAFFYFAYGFEEYVKRFGLLGNCDPTPEMLRAAHQACLLSWRESFQGGGTVDNLRRQCPNFCDHKEENCVWRIACKRCENLYALCLRAIPVCEKYIASNLPKSDEERCPQFELCRPGPGRMETVRQICENIYAKWKEASDNGTDITELDPGVCNEFCKHLKHGHEDCAWRISCKKCQLLVKLTRGGRLAAFRKQFKVIMEKKEGERCSHYEEDIFPFWWITGNWV